MPNIDEQMERLNRPNPLDAVPDTEDSEHDCKEQVSATMRAFKEAARNERQTFDDNVNPNFYICMVFQSATQREEFLNQAGWPHDESVYVDGNAVARKMGVELTPAKVKFNTGEREKSMVQIGIIPPAKRRK